MKAYLALPVGPELEGTVADDESAGVVIGVGEGHLGHGGLEADRGLFTGPAWDACGGNFGVAAELREVVEDAFTLVVLLGVVG